MMQHALAPNGVPQAMPPHAFPGSADDPLSSESLSQFLVDARLDCYAAVFRKQGFTNVASLRRFVASSPDAMRQLVEKTGLKPGHQMKLRIALGRLSGEEQDDGEDSDAAGVIESDEEQAYMPSGLSSQANTFQPTPNGFMPPANNGQPPFNPPQPMQPPQQRDFNVFQGGSIPPVHPHLPPPPQRFGRPPSALTPEFVGTPLSNPGSFDEIAVPGPTQPSSSSFGGGYSMFSSLSSLSSNPAPNGSAPGSPRDTRQARGGPDAFSALESMGRSLVSSLFLDDDAGGAEAAATEAARTPQTASRSISFSLSDPPPTAATRPDVPDALGWRPGTGQDPSVEEYKKQLEERARQEKQEELAPEPRKPTTKSRRGRHAKKREAAAAAAAPSAAAIVAAASGGSNTSRPKRGRGIATAAAMNQRNQPLSAEFFPSLADAANKPDAKRGVTQPPVAATETRRRGARGARSGGRALATMAQPEKTTRRGRRPKKDADGKRAAVSTQPAVKKAPYSGPGSIQGLFASYGPPTEGKPVVEEADVPMPGPKSKSGDECADGYHCKRGLKCTQPHSADQVAYFKQPQAKAKRCTRNMGGVCDKQPEACSYAHSTKDARCLRCHERGHFLGSCAQTKTRRCMRKNGKVCDRDPMMCGFSHNEADARCATCMRRGHYTENCPQ